MADVQEAHGKLAPGIKFLHRRVKVLSYEAYQVLVLVLTFVAYALYHLSRKPPSIVKSVLDPDPNSARANNAGGAPAPGGVLRWGAPCQLSAEGWAPFNGKAGKGLLGEMDLAFLGAYAVGMYFSGHFGDRVDLRYFLATGMIGSGVFVCLFGAACFWNIHSMWYFVVVQICSGLLQATGWPSVVSVMANWFGKGRRGLIMGAWNAHTSVGNILGSVVASALLPYGWGWSFIVPGLLIITGGLAVLLFLPVHPEDLELPPPVLRSPHRPKTPHVEVHVGGSSAGFPNALLLESEDEETASALGGGEGEQQTLLPVATPLAVVREKRGPAVVVPESEREALGFLDAWRIPGVMPFALCLFFSKLVAYTFLYWLPFYIRHTKIAGKYVDTAMAGYLSTVFDVGGVVGGILAGYISDHSGAAGCTSAAFVYLAIPAMWLYSLLGGLSLGVNVGLMAVVGVFVNGPYALITTAVSADLGTHSSLKANSKALATVTAIIDGTGSVGAALGPLMTGYISQIGGPHGWSFVFYMLMGSALAAGLLLSRVVAGEVAAIRGAWEREAEARAAVAAAQAVVVERQKKAMVVEEGIGGVRKLEGGTRYLPAWADGSS